MKMADEIITELWKVKDAIAKEHNCDVKAFVAYLGTKKPEGNNRAVDLRLTKQAAKRNNTADGEPMGA